ncbi:MAG: type I DNA topoisomerase [Desulfobacterales bacterium]
MNKPLLIVESPTKVKTLKKYLGNDYEIEATLGHIKDLPQNELGVDVENGFKPIYKNIPGKQKVISSLKKAAGDTQDVYLAPDPDREGEAIAWHTAEILKKKGRKFYRVLFHELTENAIRQAMASPMQLDENKYEAQQARRILDRLVGYEVSPLLWRKVQGGLSAGRVQSVALRIICEREKAIQAFEPEEYWSITALFEGDVPPPFSARLTRKNNRKLTIPDVNAANSILEKLSSVQPVVEKVVKKTVKRNPLPPFTTSKLQQDAIKKLKFSAKKTMVVAQQLYEGVELDRGEHVGLITYMRTDSVRISQEAAEEAQMMIMEKFGPDFSLKQPRFFKNTKKAQDAHEAIRPTSVLNTPEKLAPYLNADQLALYQLIWKRFVASQMAQALINQVSVSVTCGEYTFSASGSNVKFAGFLALYQSEEQESSFDARTEQLPELSEKTVLKVQQYEPKQHFTQAPPRFSEASLVKELEENGIGRPSTYASILSTIREKKYVGLEKGYFKPNELGFIVNELLVEHFPDVFSVDFTSNMENNLDLLESAEADSHEVLERFYDHFKKNLDIAVTDMLSVKGVGFPTHLKCPECNSTIHLKIGKNGPFLACSGYPECKYTRDYTRDEKGIIRPTEPMAEELTDKTCERCGKPMVLKSGKYGQFLACSGYPECKYTRSLDPKESGKATGITCPEENCDGEIVERVSKRGKTFYGCSRFPKCNFASWDKPVDKQCPECGSKFLVHRSTKKEGEFLACPDKKCGYKEFVETS